MRKVISGNYAAAYGAKLSRPKVISIYPITPQTTIIEKLVEFCTSGELDARIMHVESEHSAMAGCIGASAAGVRTFTATSGQGIALMHELLFFAGGARLPIVMINVHRYLASPWSLGVEQTDSLAQRDAGWIQLECEDAQEALDTVPQAYRIAEETMLPCLISFDGFILSHTYEPVDIPDAELVDKYLPAYNPPFKLDPDDPALFFGSSTSSPKMTYELRYHREQAIQSVPEILKKAQDEFYELFGRRYNAVEEYNLEGAEIVVVAAGSMLSTARKVVTELQQEGKKVGLLSIRMFRPFPKEEIQRLLRGVPKVMVLDRNISFGEGGIYCQSVKSALYDIDKRPVIFGFIIGLGGVDITPEMIKRVILYTLRHDKPEKDIIWTEVVK